MGDCFSKFTLEGQQEENHEVEFWIQEVHPERKTRATRERYPDLWEVRLYLKLGYGEGWSLRQMHQSWGSPSTGAAELCSTFPRELPSRGI